MQKKKRSKRQQRSSYEKAHPLEWSSFEEYSSIPALLTGSTCKFTTAQQSILQGRIRKSGKGGKKQRWRSSRASPCQPWDLPWPATATPPQGGKSAQLGYFSTPPNVFRNTRQNLPRIALLCFLLDSLPPSLWTAFSLPADTGSRLLIKRASLFPSFFSPSVVSYALTPNKWQGQSSLMG